jgi:hypothetical protein
LTIKLTPYTESVSSSSFQLPSKHFCLLSCLDAIASAPLLPPSRAEAGELVASVFGCATEYNAHQIFNCQRSEVLLPLRAFAAFNQVLCI